VLTPEVMPYWYTPHYTGMISPTIWVLIMPLVLYMTWRAIRGHTLVLLPLSWFICSYLIWIPLSLITDRVTYLFYFYPTVGAIALGLAIAMSPMLNRAWGRGVISVYLLLHVIAFVVLSPVALGWSIPLGLLLYVLIFWSTGLGEGLYLRRREPPEDDEEPD
jgi:dolichyl-phosphate-mannose-protein mannosyltransferase